MTQQEQRKCLQSCDLILSTKVPTGTLLTATGPYTYAKRYYHSHKVWTVVRCRYVVRSDPVSVEL